MNMNFLEVIGIVLLTVMGVAAVGAIVVYSVVSLVKVIGWIVKHIARFVWGEVSDVARFIGAILLAVLYVPMILGCILIWRWSAARHYGSALTNELGTAGVCLYRVVIGHPLRLVCLNGLTEGLERRLPAVMAAAPTADLPHTVAAAGGRGGGGGGAGGSPGSKRGQFEGYNIVGSLAAGGSGAKLYVAEPDYIKAAWFANTGMNVGQVVIKSFSLAEGSSLPQIVRESRSLDAAKRLGLILDHDLTSERFYYVMRYVPGESLSLMTHQLHAASPASGLGDFQLAAALSYACDLVATLSTYHRGGLWHKDVKPDNIIVATRTDRKAHLVDFGLVSSLRSAMTLTTHGTEYFRDPEMVRLALKGVKVHEVDGTKFDIFAAGAVVYSMIEDSFPAHGVLSQVSKRCPEAVKWVIRRAMTEYDKRYVSADAMLADLQYVAMAKDPFVIRPVDLPSMQGGFAGNEQPEVFAATQAAFAAAGAAVAAAQGTQRAGSPVPPPIPAGSPTPASAGTPNLQARRVPRLRIKNWWSGSVAVEGHDDVVAASGPFVPPHVKEAARHAAAAAQRSVQAAMAAVGLGGAAAVGGSVVPTENPPGTPVAATPPPIPDASIPSASRIVDPAKRKSAVEQIKAARDRVNSIRGRAHARLANRRTSPKHFKTGPNGGVALALFIFLGGCIGVGALVMSPSVSRHNSVSVVSFDDEGTAEARGPATDESAAFDDPAADVAVAVADVREQITHITQEAALIAQDVAENSVAEARTGNGRDKPRPQATPTPSIAPGSLGKALFINDCKRPWSDAAKTRIDSVAASLIGSGLALIGESPIKGYEAAEDEVTYAASVRMNVGQSPFDSADMDKAILAWLKDHPDVAAAVWVAPSPKDGEAAPMLKFRLNPAADQKVLARAVSRAKDAGKRK